MIILLAYDYDDARRWDDATQLDEESILIAEPGDVHKHARRFTPGARIVRTDRWQYHAGIVGALQALRTRVPLVDPTGLLGPVDPHKRDTPVSGPARVHNDPPAKGRSR